MRVSTQRAELAIHFGRRTLCAVEVEHRRGHDTVRRAVAIAVPREIAAAATDARGAWALDALRSAGFTPTFATWLLDRERASVRRLVLPTTDLDEIPDMARLAAQRDATVDAGGLVVDAVPRNREEKGTAVLAAIAPAAAVTEIRELAAASQFPLRRLSLRAFGVAWLLRGTAGRSDEGTRVGLDASADAVELVVVRDGELAAAHGATVAVDSDAPGVVASACATEAKRLWLAHRLAPQSARETSGSRSVLLFADRAIALEVSAALGGDVTPSAFRAPPSIRIEHAEADALAACWPLVGVLLESAHGEETIDLAAPRQAPDVAARRRRRAIVAAGVLTIAGLGGWTFGNLNRRAFEERVSDLRDKATLALPEHHRFKRDQLKLGHLETWASVRPDWLEHVLALHEVAPDPAVVVLDNWSGTLEASDVEYGRDSGFSVAQDLRIVLEGEARDRAAADAFRDRLVEDARYTVRSTGADTRGGRRLASPFTYVLRSLPPAQPAPSGEGVGASP